MPGRVVGLGSFGWVVAIAAVSFGAAPSQQAKLEFFENQVRPLLVEHCQKCHGTEKQESGLRVDSRDALMRGGQSGAAVVAGKPEESLLMSAVRFEGLEMPPEAKLADAQIAALETWIRDGAVWPTGDAPAGPALGDQKALFAQAKTHWSLQPVVKPKMPEMDGNRTRVRTPVDAFILAKLEAAGLEPAAEADPATLLRRVYFDLVGLPPSAEEVDEFVRDHSDEAYAAVVDKLLASQHYGERWGRHWLDVARYADTRDFIAAGADRRYPYAYTYRDWVVKAFNEDLPYDEFIRQQLAADFYTNDKQSPSLAALGLLTVGPRFNNNSFEQIADRIDVVGRGFLGLAITCARCHDHKYDPIPTADYYALYGVFASCEEPTEMPLIAGMIPPADLLKDYERARAEKLADKQKYGEALRDEATTDLRARLGEYLAGYYEMSIAKTESIRGLLSNRKLKETAMTPLAENLERVKRTDAAKNDPVLGPLLHNLGVIDQNFLGHLRRTLKSGTNDVAQDPQPINAVVLERLKADTPADKQALLALYAELLGEAEAKWQAALQKNPDAKQLADADWEQIRQAIYAADTPFALEPTACMQAARLLGAARQKQADLDNAVKQVDITHPGAPAKAFVLVDKEKPVEPVVFLRGDPGRRGEKTTRHFLEVLGGGDAHAFKIGSGRKELAEAIASPTNPLTARVFVNRVWQHLFGEGIVDTSGDFGFRSNPPSHPELLDWLAATFMENGWSVKDLHRTLVLSSTYRQASRGQGSGDRGQAEEKDPDNRLLAHANRRRLDFEAMRDAMLAVAGNLDETVGGRAIDLSATPFTHRRTVYGFVDRLNMDPLFTTFDFASPDVSTAERPNTLIPQQALFGMNHPFVIAQARALCNRPEFQNAKDDAARMTILYRRIFGRAPTADEIKLAEVFAAATAAVPDDSSADTVWQYGYGAADPQADADDRFHALKFFDGKTYQAGPVIPDPQLGHVRLTAVGGHPGRNQEQAVVRRWTSPIDGTVSIAGTLAHLRDTGDGVRGRITTGDGRVLGEWNAFNDKAETNVAQVAVRRGDVIDFVVDCVEKSTADNFTWSPTISVIADPKNKQAATSWSARSDFVGPPPPRLTPGEQTAQALLLTNEFWFVD